MGVRTLSKHRGAESNPDATPCRLLARGGCNSERRRRRVPDYCSKWGPACVGYSTQRVDFLTSLHDDNVPCDPLPRKAE